MISLPFLHPALLGVGVGCALAWSALAPDRLRSGWTVTCVGAAGALLASLTGMVPFIGSLGLGAFGALMLAAALVAWWIAHRRGMRLGLDPYFVRAQLAIGVVAGTLGARLWYVIEYRREYTGHSFGDWLTWAVDLDRGGAVWFGGMILAIVAMVIHARRERVPLLAWADCAAPATLAGLAIGRIGCFFNGGLYEGCCYGRHCDLPWAVKHDTGKIMVFGDKVQPIYDMVHPTQLYESLACAIMVVLIVRCAPGSGRATGWTLVGYSCWRFFNETLRGDYAVKLERDFSLSKFHLTSAQWTAIPLLLLGLWLLWRSRRPANALPAASVVQ